MVGDIRYYQLARLGMEAIRGEGTETFDEKTPGAKIVLETLGHYWCTVVSRPQSDEQQEEKD
jgi:hypothetical protein